MSIINILVLTLLAIPLITYNFIRLYRMRQIGIVVGEETSMYDLELGSLINDVSKRKTKQVYVVQNLSEVEKNHYSKTEAFSIMLKGMLEYKASIKFLIDNKINIHEHNDEDIYDIILLGAEYSTVKDVNDMFKLDLDTIDSQEKLYTHIYDLLTCLYLISDKSISRMAEVIKYINRDTEYHKKESYLRGQDFIENIKTEFDNYKLEQYVETIEKLETKDGLSGALWKIKIKLLTMSTNAYIGIQKHIDRVNVFMDNNIFSIKYFTGFYYIMLVTIVHSLIFGAIIKHIDKQIAKHINYDNFISSYSLPDAPSEILYNIAVLPYIETKYETQNA